MNWVTIRQRAPTHFDAYDVTLQDWDGGRLINVALFRPEEARWELMIDKHNYEGCKVIAWKERSEPYIGIV
jgi:hypothetical protein